MLRKIIVSGLILALAACKGEKEPRAIITTDYGEITIKLYNQTPKHRDNFIKLVKKGYYDDLLFHRVINTFMIQGGDPESKNASPMKGLGNGGPGYTLPAEILPGLYHKKGAVAAARLPDNINPEKASSGSQFYIVQGTVMSESQLNQIESSKQLKYTSKQREAYKTIGGAPHLDNDYTVFGEVVKGLEVVDKIAAVRVAGRNRPLQDVKMKIRMK